ncbi:hypothetical protein V5799_026209 [Amblyomma americanum]|uniref:Uncharacterized protein n=1 Tax=Amblyomma americanum TaxID=6943 RepID=A0AAQ4DJ85_AMBAM
MALFPDKDMDAAAWAESSMGAPPIIEEYIFNKPLSDVSLDKDSDNDATERVLKLEEIPSESFTAPAVVDWDAIANDVDGMLTKVYTTREDFGPGAPKNQAETRASKRYCDKEKNGGDEDETPGALLPKSLAPSSLSQPVYVNASPVCRLPEDSTSKDNITFALVRRDTMQGDSRASLNHSQVFNMTATPLMPGDGQGPMVITPTPTKDACKKAYQMECFTVDGEGPMSTQIGETPWQEVTGPATDKPFSPFGHHSPPTVTAFAMVEQQLSAPEYMYSEAVSQASDPPVQEPWPQLLGPWYPHPLCPVHSPQHHDRGVLLNG